MNVGIKLLLGGKLPAKADTGSHGYDCYSTEHWVIVPGDTIKVSLGFCLELPETLMALITPRSGLALKHGLTILNSPGLIDSSYRGEVCALVHNAGKKAYHLSAGERICQMIFQVVPEVEFRLEQALSDTERGEKGFGSTGYT